MPSPQANTAVALLCETQSLGRHLRDALTSMGTPIVYEAAPADLDLAALANSGARVVVVNLDPEVEAHLDEVYGLLEDDRYSVVFNDAQASSALSGWDHARWARHLAAKILGDIDIDPPRPEGAEAIPTPVAVAAAAPSIVEHAPVVDRARVDGPHMDEAYADEADADHAEPAREVDAATYAETLRSIIEGVREEPATAGVGDPLDMLESRYEEMNKPATTAFAPPPPPPAEDAFDFSTLEALTASYAPPPPAEVSATPTFAPEFLDEAESIEMPDFVDEGPSGAADFSADAGEAPRPLAPASAFDGAPEATDDELAASIDDVFDLDALEKLFGDAPVDLAREPASVDVGDLGDLGDLGDSHSAEAPLIEEHASGHAEPVETAASGFTFVDDVDVVPAPTHAPNEPTTMTSTLKLAAAADWSLEDMLEGDMPSSPMPVGPADFGIEKLSAAEYLAPSTENTAPPPVPDSDFSFELMPMEEAVAPQAIEREVVETWLDPDKVVLPPKIRRVWVLGASIGGPEAVRDFLGELPRDYPALFLLAQHMGVEFVDLMAQQLAKSTPLTVRTPTHGERVGHGEVVIVPTTHRLQVDPEGVVVLERISSDGAYSPSIDRVLRDVADRYGANAGAIVFSGMTTDAVEGSKYLTGKGGTVYAQHPDTCVVSSMIDGVVELGVVKFLGSPKELAEQLLAETAKSKR